MNRRQKIGTADGYGVGGAEGRGGVEAKVRRKGKGGAYTGWGRRRRCRGMKEGLGKEHKEQRAAWGEKNERVRMGRGRGRGGGERKVGGSVLRGRDRQWKGGGREGAGGGKGARKRRGIGVGGVLRGVSGVMGYMRNEKMGTKEGSWSVRDGRKGGKGRGEEGIDRVVDRGWAGRGEGVCGIKRWAGGRGADGPGRGKLERRGGVDGRKAGGEVKVRYEEDEERRYGKGNWGEVGQEWTLEGGSREEVKRAEEGGGREEIGGGVAWRDRTVRIVLAVKASSGWGRRSDWTRSEWGAGRGMSQDERGEGAVGRGEVGGGGDGTVRRGDVRNMRVKGRRRHVGWAVVEGRELIAKIKDRDGGVWKSEGVARERSGGEWAW
ncbi:hypothetical protein Tco_0270821 [Tanacetum coccineum]